MTFLLIRKLSLAAVLSVMTASSFAGSTGPTVPTDPPRPSAPQPVEPTLKNDAKNLNDTDVPTHPSMDPRIQGNDAGRQGGMNTDGNGPQNRDDSTTTLSGPQPDTPEP